MTPLRPSYDYTNDVAYGKRKTEMNENHGSHIRWIGGLRCIVGLP